MVWLPCQGGRACIPYRSPELCRWGSRAPGRSNQARQVCVGEGYDEIPVPHRVDQTLQPWQLVGLEREAQTTKPSLVCGIDSQCEGQAGSMDTGEHQKLDRKITQQPKAEWQWPLWRALTKTGCLHTSDTIAVQMILDRCGSQPGRDGTGPPASKGSIFRN